jgi:hypothetical protein
VEAGLTWPDIQWLARTFPTRIMQVLLIVLRLDILEEFQKVVSAPLGGMASGDAANRSKAAGAKGRLPYCRSNFRWENMGNCCGNTVTATSTSIPWTPPAPARREMFKFQPSRPTLNTSAGLLNHWQLGMGHNMMTSLASSLFQSNDTTTAHEVAHARVTRN